MKPLDGKTVIVNPPLSVPGNHIDNPAFAFYQAAWLYCKYSALDPTCQLADSFIGGTARENNGEACFGGSDNDLLRRIVDTGAQYAIFHYSSFLRARGLFHRTLKLFEQELATRGIGFHLADMSDTSTHYLNYDEAVVRAVYPSVGMIIREPVQHWNPGTAADTSDSASPVQFAAQYRTFLQQAASANLIKDNIEKVLTFPYLSSVGCPYNCLFCKPRGDRWVGRSAAAVIHDLEFLTDEGYRSICFTDPYANYDTTRFEEILSHCATKNIRLHFANGVGLRHINRDIARLLAKVTSRLFVSPESLNDDSLKTLKKPFDSTEATAAMHLLADEGCHVVAHFIHGIPDESRQDQLASLKRAAALEEHPQISGHFQRFVSRENLTVNTPRCANVYDRFLPDRAPDQWTRVALNNHRVKTSLIDQAKIIINVSYRCNNNCTFCAVGDRQRADGSLAQQLSLIETAHAEGVRLLDLDGGEPLMYAHLFALLDAAADFDVINITTNGRLLAYREFARRLSEYRNVSWLISLHSADPAEHDELTRVPGSWAETVEGLHNAIALFSNVGVNTTVTRRNYRSLKAMADLVAASGAKTYNIQWYTPFGVVDRNFFAPAEAMAHVQQVIDKQRNNLRINLVNFNYCQAPELYPYMIADLYKAVRRMLFCDGQIVNLSEYLAQQRYRSEFCETCECANVCQGHWKHTNAEPGAPFVRYQNRRHIALLDIIPGYSCNRGCTFCTCSGEMRKTNLSTEAVFQKIDIALRDYVPRNARIGGGEPTLRRDLPAIVSRLKARGIKSVAIQSNGLVLSYPEALARLLSAGLDRVNLSIPTMNEQSLAVLTRVTDSLPLIQQALELIIARNIQVEIDILISRPTLLTLNDTVAQLISRGVRRMNFMHIAEEGNAAQRGDELIPSLSESALAIAPILKQHTDVVFRAFYFPYCLFRHNLEIVWHPLEEDAFVITPDNSFALQSGEIGVGVFAEKCDSCSLKSSCYGLRQSYITRFGTEEITPL